MLRAILTMLIIAFGIMSLVGILTSIDALKSSINSNFAQLGSNTFTIRKSGLGIRIGRGGQRAKVHDKLTYDQCLKFKKLYNYPSVASVSARGTGTATLKYKSNETNPNIAVLGGDENYLTTSGYELQKGRGFSEHEITQGTKVIILGKELINTLFPNTPNPLDKLISVGTDKYRVIGILKSKGSSMGMGGDRQAIIPLTVVREKFMDEGTSFTISVMTNTPQEMDLAISEATGIFRIIRNDPLDEEPSFEVVRSDSLSNILIEQTGTIQFAAVAIGLITLLGAAIGLMNIMLVSVTERTREIGVRKAIGASSAAVRLQFLTEAVVICQLGGLIGIALGIIIGNVVGMIIGSGFVIPWAWMLLGVTLCLIVGLISGIYPAHKAASQNPVDALRYE